MLIPGTPAILTPANGPLSGPLSGSHGLGAFPTNRYPSEAQRWRDEYIASGGTQAQIDAVQAAIQAGGSDVDIARRLRAINANWRATGVWYDDFVAFMVRAASMESLQDLWNARGEMDQRAAARALMAAAQSDLGDDEVRQVTGYDKAGLIRWAQSQLDRDDSRLIEAFSIITGMGLTRSQVGALVAQLAARESLSAQDVARLGGMSLDEARALLGRTVPWSGLGSVAQPQADAPGLVLDVGDDGRWVWYFIPAASSPIARVDRGAGDVAIVTTVDGVSAAIAPGSAGVRKLPIRDDTWGRLLRLRNDRSMDYIAKNRALLAAAQSMGLSIMTDAEEINQWTLEPVSTITAWIDTERPDFEAVGVQATNFEQDAALNAEFAAVYQNQGLSEDEKAQAFTDIAQRENLSVEDVARIVGVQTAIVGDFMAQGGYGSDIYGAPVPVSIALPEVRPLTIPGLEVLADVDNVTQAYRAILGREPDEGGLRFYTTGGFTLEQVEADMRQSAEAAQRSRGTSTSLPEVMPEVMRTLTPNITDGTITDGIVALPGPSTVTPAPTSTPTAAAAAGGGVAPLLLAVAAAYLLGA